MRGEPLYYPGPGREWQSRRPDEVGLNRSALNNAVAFALSHETSWETNLAAVIRALFKDEGPFSEIIGPTKERGGPNGLVLRHGYVVAEWGDTDRVDMTFSASKCYLATVAGLALDHGVIRDLDDPVREYVDDGGFDSPRNREITWRHLLHQTSEWQGTLWGKPVHVDQGRTAPSGSIGAGEGQDTSHLHRSPGTVWEYNDVRVNRLALSLLRCWRRPLPDLLRECVMDPIGASQTWEWHGYRNSYVSIDGVQMQSVSGGAHWGGGLWISSRDHARFGYLHLRRGVWNGRRLLSERWLDLATSPCPVKPTHGCLWSLNTGRSMYPSAPETSVFVLGAGQNAVWIDPDHDLVAVVRWIDHDALDGFIQRVLAAF